VLTGRIVDQVEDLFHLRIPDFASRKAYFRDAIGKSVRATWTFGLVVVTANTTIIASNEP
jgi:hypothetical protein